MKTTILFLILLLALSALAGWERTYGGSSFERGNSVALTLDGGFIITGPTRSFGAGNYDFYLVKTDSIGDTMWTRTYGGAYDDWSMAVIQTEDSGYAIIGKTYTSGFGSDVYLIKTDSSGDTIWTKTYGGTGDSCESGYSIAQTYDGGYILAGEKSLSFDTGRNNVYLIKTDSYGDTIWTRTYGGEQDECGYSVAQTLDSGYVVTGCTESFGAGERDLYLIKTNSLGDTIWTRAYGGTDNDYGYSVAQTTDGGYIVAGKTYSFGVGTPDKENVYLLKFDAFGDTVWTRTYGGTDSDYAWSLGLTTDGGYILAGRTESFGAGYIDVYLIKTDALGESLWTRTYGGSLSDRAKSVAQISDGGFIIAGFTNSYGIDSLDIYLIKTDSLGYTGIEENPPSAKPEAFALSAWPNPFNGTVTISLSAIPYGPYGSSENPEIEIFDINGRRISVISSEGLQSDEKSPADSEKISPFGRNDNGGKFIWQPDPSLGSGVYLVRAMGAEQSTSKRIVYMK